MLGLLGLLWPLGLLGEHDTTVKERQLQILQSYKYNYVKLLGESSQIMNEKLAQSQRLREQWDQTTSDYDKTDWENTE
jgi:hypothetical protein